MRSNLTLGLGLRYEYWHSKELRAGNGATFDPAIGKVIAGVDSDGNVNLANQPVSPFLAAATAGAVGAGQRGRHARTGSSRPTAISRRGSA